MQFLRHNDCIPGTSVPSERVFSTVLWLPPACWAWSKLYGFFDSPPGQWRSRISPGAANGQSDYDRWVIVFVRGMEREIGREQTQLYNDAMAQNTYDTFIPNAKQIFYAMSLHSKLKFASSACEIFAWSDVVESNLLTSLTSASKRKQTFAVCV